MTTHRRNSTKIAIIGPGRMGARLGKIWSQAGHEVTLCFGRDQQKLQSAARSGGSQARTAHPAEATASSHSAHFTGSLGKILMNMWPTATIILTTILFPNEKHLLVIKY